MANYGNNYKGGNQRYNNNGNGRNDGPPKKHSGCKTGFAHGVADRPFVRGWKYDRTHGMRSIIAGPNKKTKRTKSKTGQEWENWTAKVKGPNGVQLYNALYHVQKKRVYIQDLGLVMSPSGGVGGYVGPYFRRKN